MKKRTKLGLIFLVLLSPVMSSSHLRSTKANPAASDLKRMRFQIATIRERAGQRDVVSSSEIEGPPGTDFDIDLQDVRFKMSAKFLTDLEAGDALKVRAELQTRRLYGRSEQGLPLYEEDQQSHTLRLGLDEDIILLPFGPSGGDESLKIQITPTVTEESVYAPSGELRPLGIKILKVTQDGAVSIRASKIPHHYEAEVRLLENGREIARRSQSLLFEEAQELLLQPDAQASDEVVSNTLAVKLKIDEYMRTRPSDEVAINFDIHRIDSRNAGKRETVGLNWAGIGKVGSDLRYDLSNYYQPDSGKKYELIFVIKIAKGEIVD